MENNIANVFINKGTRAAAIGLVHKCGVRADLKGSDCLAEAVMLYAENRNKGFCEIYRIIAERRGLKPKSVLRQISYALNASTDITERISEITGLAFDEQDVHAARIIAYLARLLELPEIMRK